MDELFHRIKEHEGYRKKLYVDSVGKQSIGIGRNLTDRGLRDDEILLLYNNDMSESIREMRQFEWWNQLDRVRKEVILELHFNIGLTRLLKFRQTIAALEKKDYEGASMHLLNSLWAKQVGPNRSNDMANRLRTGAY